MRLEFEWDPRKPAQDLTQHGVSFEEASTVSSGVLSVTIPDPEHSEDEERRSILGQSHLLRLLVVGHPDDGETVRSISATLAETLERRKYEEAGPSRNRDDGMRGYYDFTGGVRGKYAKRYSEGANVVVLDPDVAQVIRDKEPVNQTLRAAARIFDMQSPKKRSPRPTGRSSRPRPRGRSGRHDRVRVGGRGG